MSAKSTASQHQFIDLLAHKVGKDVFAEQCFNKAASLNNNADFMDMKRMCSSIQATYQGRCIYAHQTSAERIKNEALEVHVEA